jgi:hypothetical protein
MRHASFSDEHAKGVVDLICGSEHVADVGIEKN